MSFLSNPNPTSNFSLSDMTTQLAIAASVNIWVAPNAGVLVDCIIGLLTAATVGTTSVDLLNQAGQSVFSTLPIIAATQKNNLGVGSTRAIVNPARATFAKGDVFTWSITAAGTTAAGLQSSIGYTG